MHRLTLRVGHVGSHSHEHFLHLDPRGRLHTFRFQLDSLDGRADRAARRGLSPHPRPYGCPRLTVPTLRESGRNVSSHPFLPSFLRVQSSGVPGRQMIIALAAATNGRARDLASSRHIGRTARAFVLAREKWFNGAKHFPRKVASPSSRRGWLRVATNTLVSCAKKRGCAADRPVGFCAMYEVCTKRSLPK